MSFNKLATTRPTYTSITEGCFEAIEKDSTPYNLSVIFSICRYVFFQEREIEGKKERKRDGGGRRGMPK